MLRSRSTDDLNKLSQPAPSSQPNPSSTVKEMFELRHLAAEMFLKEKQVEKIKAEEAKAERKKKALQARELELKEMRRRLNEESLEQERRWEKRRQQEVAERKEAAERAAAREKKRQEELEAQCEQARQERMRLTYWTGLFYGVDGLSYALGKISDKMYDLERRKYHADAAIGRTMLKNIAAEQGIIFDKLNKDKANAKVSEEYRAKLNDWAREFAEKCHAHIEAARPALEKHRGWKRVLANLALAIAGLGVGYVVAGLINKKRTGHFLFFFDKKTTSGQLLDDLHQKVTYISRGLVKRE